MAPVYEVHTGTNDLHVPSDFVPNLLKFEHSHSSTVSLSNSPIYL